MLRICWACSYVHSQHFLPTRKETVLFVVDRCLESLIICSLVRNRITLNSLYQMYVTEVF